MSLDGDCGVLCGARSTTSPTVTAEHTSETDMTHSTHRAARSQSPAADVIRLPHRTVARPAGPAIEPPGIPAYVPELLRRAAEDLAFAETILEPGPEVPARSAGPDRSGQAAPEDPGVPATVPDGTHVEVRLLGCFKIRRAGQDVASSSFGGRRSRQLLQILLTGRGRLIPKDVLVEALWPRRDLADPQGNLAVLASRARHALGQASLILSRPGGYLYAEDDRTWVDAEAFAHEVERGRVSLATGSATAAARAYRSALALWTSDPLMEDMYAEWAQRFRRRFSLLYEESLEGLAKASLELGQPTTAQDAARQLTERAPLNEEGHLLLMKALVAAGNPAGAIRSFHEWRDRLAAELGVDPSPEAQGVFQHILRNESAGRVRRVPPGTPPPGSQSTACPGLPGDVLGWIPDAVYVLGHDEHLVYANQPAADLAGLPVGCLAGMAARAVFPGDWLEAYRNCAGTALAAREPDCFRAFCAPLDCWLEWTVYPGEQGFLILSRDITRMVKTEQRVRRALAAVQASRSDLLTQPSGNEGEPQRADAEFVP
ncbi:MAG: AfsR/SARP family transcriptional regulator [Streptosporangiaceae bacterium]